MKMVTGKMRIMRMGTRRMGTRAWEYCGWVQEHGNIEDGDKTMGIFRMGTKAWECCG